MNPDARFPCPCCGYRTYEWQAGGTMQLCPVCFWEDAPGEQCWNGSNQVDLVGAQRNFTEFGACERDYQDVVRPPTTEERRSSHWLSFEELREKIITLIERSFHDVTRDGGTTLHQMDLVDGGWLMNSRAMLEAARNDPESRWQDIAVGKLSKFHQSLVFLDDLGFRFYLPAFMRHALLTCTPEIWNAEIDGVLWSLDGGPHDTYRAAAFAMLQREQKEATAAFLQFFATWGDDGQAPYARKGLKSGWNAYIPLPITLATL